MKNWGRLLLIFFAYGIALLHTAVPHHHANTGSGDTVFSHRGCVYSNFTSGLLQRVLSTDLGAGHLETFKKGGDLEIVFSAPHADNITVLTSVVTLISNQQALPEYAGAFIQKLQQQLCLFSVSHFRAPPLG